MGLGNRGGKAATQSECFLAVASFQLHISVISIFADLTKDKQILQTVNGAHALHSLAAESSAYIPLSTRPPKLPSYIHTELDHPWQYSALLATAFESITLPTRLRQRTAFDEFEAILSNDGKRKIEKIQITVDDPADLEMRSKDDRKDGRVNGLTNGHYSEDAQTQPDQLDIDISEGRPIPSAGVRVKKPHTFSRVDVYRGPWPLIESSELTPYDRFGSDAVVRNYQTNLLYPILSSFPEIFRLAADKKKLAVRAALSTETGISDKVKMMAQFVGRAVGVEEREILRNGLIEISEEYVDGWESESDEEDD